MQYIKFAPVHLEMFIHQPSQADFGECFKDKQYAKHLASQESYTAVEDGYIYGCGGVIEMWEGRALLWSLLSENAGAKMMNIHRVTKDFIRGLLYHRIEMTVDSNFRNGKRWAEMLGFQYEGTMRGYTPDRRDCDLYAIVRG